MGEAFALLTLPLAIFVWAACRPGPFPKRRVHYLTYPEPMTKRERQAGRRSTSKGHRP